MPEEGSASTRYMVTLQDLAPLPTPNRVLLRTPYLHLSRIGRGQFIREEEQRVIISETVYRQNRERFVRQALDLIADDPTPRKLLDSAREWRNRQITYVFTPSTIGDGLVAKMAASLRIPVTLAPGADWPEHALDELVDYFLHSPTLSMPIEPFYSISRAYGGQPTTLWEVYSEILGIHWYVLPDGRVSLSERWARDGHFFGRIDDPMEILQQSELWRFLGGFKHRIFARQEVCAFCRHYPYCAGYWAAPKPDQPQCAAWMTPMDRICEAFRAETTPAAEPA